MIKQFSVFNIKTDPADLADDMALKLEQKAFTPCGTFDLRSQGFITTLNEEEYAPRLNGCAYFAVKTETKIIPAPAIKDLVNKKVAEIEVEQGRKVYRKEKADIKESTIQGMLPQAFTKSNVVHGYADIKRGYIVVGTASRNKAEGVLSLIREAIGSLPLVPLMVNNHPKSVMSNWYIMGAPSDFSLLNDFKITNSNHLSNVVNFRHQSETSAVDELISEGMEFSQLSIDISDQASFKLDEDLSFKQFKLSDVLEDYIEDCDDAAAQKEAYFVFQSAAIGHCVDRIVEEMGGIAE